MTNVRNFIQSCDIAHIVNHSRAIIQAHLYPTKIPKFEVKVSVQGNMLSTVGGSSIVTHPYIIALSS